MQQNNELALELELLQNLPAWRQRAIERIELSKALWSKREREIHVKPLSEVAAFPEDDPGHVPGLKKALYKAKGAVPEKETIKLILPITELPNVPLLDLHITVAGDHVYRVPLDQSARIQAAHIRKLAKLAKVDKSFGNDNLLGELLSTIFYFPTSKYEAHWRRYHQVAWQPWTWWPRSWRDWARKKVGKPQPFHEYLNKHLFPIKKHTYQEWENQSRKIRNFVEQNAMDEFLSGAQDPLIVLPHLREELEQQGHTLDEQMCGSALESLVKLLEDAHAKAQHKESEDEDERSEAKLAKKLLSTYSSYGYRWMAFARCTVPINEPFTITVKEQRSVYFTVRWRRRYKSSSKIPGDEQFGRTVWKQVSFADAETNHVSIRVADAAVRLHGKCKTLNEVGNSFDSDLDEEKKTFELYLRHDSTPDRPERIWIKCHLRLARLTSLFFYLAMTVTAVGIALLVWRGVLDSRVLEEPPATAKEYTHGITAKDAAVIMLPVAFVAAFLLVKESSTLVMRIRRLRQSILIVELFILLATAFSLYFWRLIWAKP
ncbi:hypothetical protein [Streptomyces sioyaensis]|uniref:hypothetical protein n=1 Tax=Streptomyces sioyaensis TaxID=67364 RepID=UPI0037A05986